MGTTGAERQAAWRERRGAELRKLRAKVARLERGKVGAKAKPRPSDPGKKPKAPRLFNWAAEPLTPESLLNFAGHFTRLPVLLALVPFCESRQWFRLLGEQWSLCDNVGKHWVDLLALFQFAKRADLVCMMNADERKAHAALPETFTAWRGCFDFNARGFSYSLDRDIAAKFPTYPRYHVPGRQPLLLTATIRRSECVLKLDRSEREIVAFAPEIVSEERLKRIRPA